MRACEQCGLSIGDSATFCMVCGARVDPPASPTEAPPGASDAAQSVVQSAEQSVTEGAEQSATQTAEQSVTQTAAQSGANASEQPADRDVPAGDDPQDAATRRLRAATLPMRQAGDVEKTDPAQAVTLYRDSALRLLEAAADPLDHEAVRHDLLAIFDRVSLILKREGRPEEALEEIDSAASLGLLDCQDHGIKGHREALKKRRESLRHALDGRSPSPV
jgi:hypothetical protein